MAFLSLALWLFAAGPMPVNEIVAVIEGAPITLWDLDVEARLRGLEQRGVIPDGGISDNERILSLTQLINRQLALRAADRFRVPQPNEGDVEDEVRNLLRGAVVPVRDQLVRAGISDARMRDRIRTKLRIRDLINDRLRDLIRISDEEVAKYLRQHPNAETSSTAVVREYLTTLRLQERSRTFFYDLRERASVVILDRRFSRE